MGWFGRDKVIDLWAEAAQKEKAYQAGRYAGFDEACKTYHLVHCGDLDAINRARKLMGMAPLRSESPRPGKEKMFLVDAVGVAIPEYAGYPEMASVTPPRSGYGKSQAERGMESLGYRWSEIDGLYIDTLKYSRKDSPMAKEKAMYFFGNPYGVSVLEGPANSLDEAKAWALERARHNPNSAYHVMKCVGVAKVQQQPTIWTDYE